MAETKTTGQVVEEDLSIYADIPGGFDEMTGAQLSVPLLLIRQPTTQADFGVEESVKQGDFYNSSTLKGYGSKVKLIPCYFGIMFYEWKPNMAGLAGRYSQVEFNELIASGAVSGTTFDGYYRVKDEVGNDVAPQERNKLIETWVYVVMLADHIEDGFMCYNSTPGNIKYLKQWNSLMRLKRLPPPFNKPAPLPSCVWEISTSKEKNDKGVAYHFGLDGRSNITFHSFVKGAVYLGAVKPVVEIASTAVRRIDTVALLEDTRAVEDAVVVVESTEDVFAQPAQPARPVDMAPDFGR
jgi:hypothetical protein